MVLERVNKQEMLYCQLISWFLVAVVCAIAVAAWGSSNAWRIFPLNAYPVFPLLGITAYSLMWTQYCASSLRNMWGLAPDTLKTFSHITSRVVLVLICLHPGILIYKRYQDGFGLPPGSYTHYVSPGLGWITLLGTVSLITLIALEFSRFGQRFGWWKYVLIAGDLAMIAIAYHGLRLGSQLQSEDWFRSIWIFYGLTLLFMIGYKYYQSSAGKTNTD